MQIEISEPIDPEIIKAFLKINGTNQKELANELNISPTTVRQVIHGKVKSERVAKSIAFHTGFTIKQMWPWLYKSHS